MNAVDKTGLRRFAIAALLAVGISTTIASCGGSSGGSAAPAPLIDDDPTLGITVENGSDVASAVVTAIGLSFDLGDITGDNVSAQPGDILFGTVEAKGTGFLYTSLLSQVHQALENCANGGTVDISITMADPNTLAVGDHIVAVFVDCDDGMGYVISGQVEMRIAEIQGDILTELFLLGVDVVLTDVVVTDSEDEMTAVGDFTLTLDQRNFPVLGLRVATGELQTGHADEVWTLTGCDHDMQVDVGTSPEPLTANASGRLESLLLGGSVDYSTSVAIQALGDDDPHVGEILVTGANESSVRIVVIDSNSVRLDIDENGDGTIDAFVDTTWPELNGDEPTLPPSPSPTQAVGGAWFGVDSKGHQIFALSSETGQLFWQARHDEETFLPGDADGFGSISAIGTDLMADFRYYPQFRPDDLGSSRFPEGSLYFLCSAEGTVLERHSLVVNTECTTTIDQPGTPFSSTVTLTYDPVHGQDSSLSIVSGNYSAPRETNVTIDPNGEISGRSASNECVINGQINVIDGRFNVYDVSITYSDCVAPYDAFNGRAFTGLAYFDHSAGDQVISTLSGVGIAEPFTMVRN